MSNWLFKIVLIPFKFLLERLIPYKWDVFLKQFLHVVNTVLIIRDIVSELIPTPQT